MTITLTFDTETLSLINEAAASYNSAAGTSLTPSQYIKREIEASWESKRVSSIQNSGAALTAAALSLPKADRDEVIAFIKSKLT